MPTLVFHLKPHFQRHTFTFTLYVIWQEPLLLIHPLQTFPLNEKLLHRVFVTFKRSCTARFWFSPVKSFSTNIVKRREKIAIRSYEETRKILRNGCSGDERTLFWLWVALSWKYTLIVQICSCLSERPSLLSWWAKRQFYQLWQK